MKIDRQKLKLVVAITVILVALGHLLFTFVFSKDDGWPDEVNYESDHSNQNTSEDMNPISGANSETDTHPKKIEQIEAEGDGAPGQVSVSEYKNTLSDQYMTDLTQRAYDQRSMALDIANSILSANLSTANLQQKKAEIELAKESINLANLKAKNGKRGMDRNRSTSDGATVEFIQPFKLETKKNGTASKQEKEESSPTSKTYLSVLPIKIKSITGKNSAHIYANSSLRNVKVGSKIGKIRITKINPTERYIEVTQSGNSTRRIHMNSYRKIKLSELPKEDEKKDKSNADSPEFLDSSEPFEMPFPSIGQ